MIYTVIHCFTIVWTIFRVLSDSLKNRNLSTSIEVLRTHLSPCGGLLWLGYCFLYTFRPVGAAADCIRYMFFCELQYRAKLAENRKPLKTQHETNRNCPNYRLIFIKIVYLSMFINVFLVFVHENAR